ncbi:MAG: glycosyltransferase family 4 protein [Candidatus Pacearchaeota archaeon]
MKTVLHLERKFTSKTETFIVNQINTIKNFNVIVATTKKLNNLNCDKQVIEPLKVSYISRTGKYLSNKTALSLFEAIKQFKVDIIHIHYLVDALFFLKLIDKFNLPKIVSCYGYDVSSFPNRFLGIGRLLLKKVFDKCDYFLAMSNDMKSDLLKLGCPKEKIIVHYYGTDVKRFYYPDRKYKNNSKIKLLIVGTVEEKKAQHLVIMALSRIIKDYINIELHIVGGDGGYLSKCQRLVEKYNLGKNVFFHGFIPHNSNELLNFYKNSDIFLLTSITLNDNDKEGIPGTIVEAMANGLPVISTYHAGIPYIIENEKEGLLVKERDIDGIAYSIIRLIEDDKLREKLGKNAQKKALEELDLYKGTERLEKIYEKVLNSNN